MAAWEVKDGVEDPSAGSKEPEVVKQVLHEVKKLGDNYKANYDDLNRRYSELKDTIEHTKGSMDVLVEEKLTKLSEDISTRQVSLDAANKEIASGQKSVIERLDTMEVALQRTPLSSSANKEICCVDEKSAQDFMVASLAVNGLDTSWNKVKSMTPDIGSINAYVKGFNDFIRMRGGPQQVSPDLSKMLQIGVDPDGGYTVTPYMSNRIVVALYEMDPVRQLSNIETISTSAFEQMVDWGQVGFGWEEETQAGAETTTSQWKIKRIPVHVLYAKPRASQVMLEDSSINVSNWLSTKIADRFNRGESAAFVTGDGLGKPRGFLTYATGTDYGNVEQVAMGNASALTADGFIDVKFSLIEQYLNRASWLMNRTTVAACMKLKSGSGDYIWLPGLTSKEPATILGLPVRMSTSMPAVASDALSVALADWNEAYTIVDRLGVTIQRDPFTVKPNVEFYSRKRVGGDVVNFQAIKIGKISA